MRFYWTKENRHIVVGRSFLPGLTIRIAQWQAALLDWLVLSIILAVAIFLLMRQEYLAVVILCVSFLFGWAAGRLHR